MKNLWRCLLSIAALAACTLSSAGTITYYHNDIAGSPIAATNESGAVLWRESYRPYGERLTNAPASTPNDVWFTSRRQDVDTGLVYMGARYYDPVIGRFMSTDSVGFDENNIHSFNRYAYANNNPYRYVDPDGNQAFRLLSPPPSVSSSGIATAPLGKPTQEQQVRALEGGGGSAASPGFGGADIANFLLGGFAGVAAGQLANLIFNSNPFDGPVDNSVVVVDSKGNAIPVEKGQRLGASPDSKWIEVKDSDGTPTGARLDNGHRSHTDVRAQEPHAHRPGFSNSDGTPWLPTKK